MWPSEGHLGKDRPQRRAGGKAFVLDTKVTGREGGIAVPLVSSHGLWWKWKGW